MTRSPTNEQLKDEDPHRPPVTLSAIIPISALGFQHLRRDVVWSADRCVTVHHTGLKEHNTLATPDLLSCLTEQSNQLELVAVMPALTSRRNLNDNSCKQRVGATEN